MKTCVRAGCKYKTKHLQRRHRTITPEYDFRKGKIAQCKHGGTKTEHPVREREKNRKETGIKSVAHKTYEEYPIEKDTTIEMMQKNGMKKKITSYPDRSEHWCEIN